MTRAQGSKPCSLSSSSKDHRPRQRASLPATHPLVPLLLSHSSLGSVMERLQLLGAKPRGPHLASSRRASRLLPSGPAPRARTRAARGALWAARQTEPPVWAMAAGRKRLRPPHVALAQPQPRTDALSSPPAYSLSLCESSCPGRGPVTEVCCGLLMDLSA